MEIMDYTLIIDLTQDLCIIWKNIKKKRRGDIQRAEREEIIIELNTNYDEFLEMLKKIREITNQSPFVISSEILEEFKKNDLLFVAKYHGEVIAGNWYYIRFNGARIRMRWAASKRYDAEKKNISGVAHALAIWEAIKWAKNKGMLIFDFGGYAPSGMVDGQPVEEINKWKKSFGGILAEKVC
jgi:lipid II:glycine glycyltransferase (peptidoglycan interpeptide bridge formation enzyme)